MILADTNILLRFALKDDPAQEKEAGKLLRAAQKQGLQVLVLQVVLAELVWVLERAKKVPRKDLGRFLEGLLGVRGFVFEQRSRVEAALMLYLSNDIDFADALLAAACQETGMQGVLSFDSDLAKLGAIWPGQGRRG